MSNENQSYTNEIADLTEYTSGDYRTGAWTLEGFVDRALSYVIPEDDRFNRNEQQICQMINTICSVKIRFIKYVFTDELFCKILKFMDKYVYILEHKSLVNLICSFDVKHLLTNTNNVYELNEHIVNCINASNIKTVTTIVFCTRYNKNMLAQYHADYRMGSYDVSAMDKYETVYIKPKVMTPREYNCVKNFKLVQYKYIYIHSLIVSNVADVGYIVEKLAPGQYIKNCNILQYLVYRIITCTNNKTKYLMLLTSQICDNNVLYAYSGLLDDYGNNVVTKEIRNMIKNNISCTFQNIMDTVLKSQKFCQIYRISRIADIIDYKFTDEQKYQILSNDKIRLYTTNVTESYMRILLPYFMVKYNEELFNKYKLKDKIFTDSKVYTCIHIEYDVLYKILKTNNINTTYTYFTHYHKHYLRRLKYIKNNNPLYDDFTKFDTNMSNFLINCKNRLPTKTYALILNKCTINKSTLNSIIGRPYLWNRMNGDKQTQKLLKLILDNM
jgi:hypothetical protein